MPSSTTPAAEDDYENAIGRKEHKQALISAERAEALAAALDLDGIPGGGADLLPGWHWLFFNPFVRRSELGPDGHPKRGGFLPDVKLPRRMWAGGRLVYHAPLPLDGLADRESEITKVAAKNGSAGQLVFVTVRHTISHDGKVCIEEEQDIVYREAPAPDAPNPKAVPAPQAPDWSEPFAPDPVLLFRYSALTSNGHRIHYDQPYATGEEGYPNLVVHGPLIATLLQGFAQRSRPEASLKRFDFRGMAPLFVDRGFHVEAAKAEAKTAEDEDGLTVWARGPDGELAMRADAAFSL